MKLKTCPVCSSNRIRQVKRDIQSKRGGIAYTAHGIEIEECPECGEKLFSSESLAQIDAQRPRAAKTSKRRKSV